MKGYLLSLLVFSSNAFADRAPFIAVMSGWDSCGTDENGQTSTESDGHGYRKGVELINRVAEMPQYRSETVKWMFSCFDKWGSFYFRSSSHRNIRSGTPSDASAILDTMKDESDNYQRPVVVVGHSHGGWFSMKLMARQRSEFSRGAYISLDPISYTQCNPVTYASVIYHLFKGWPFSAIAGLEPCQQSPTDVSDLERAAIHRNLNGGRWLNYYQTNFYPLHSDSIPKLHGPTQSRDMSPVLSRYPEGARPSFNAHVEIFGLQGIWRVIEGIIQNGYR